MAADGPPTDDQRYRPPVFGGDESAWSEWSFRMRSYAAELHERMDTVLERVELRDDPVIMTDMSADQQALSRKMMNLLIRSTTGPPFLILRNVDSGNGFEGWRQLCAHY